MTSGDKKRPRRSLAIWLGGVALLAILYVLSTGPAAWLSINGYLPDNVYLAAYAPLSKAEDVCPPLAYAIGYYERLWLRLPTRASGPQPEISP